MKRKVNFTLNASNYEREQTLVQRLTPLFPLTVLIACGHCSTLTLFAQVQFKETSMVGSIRCHFKPSESDPAISLIIRRSVDSYHFISQIS